MTSPSYGQYLKNKRQEHGLDEQELAELAGLQRGEIIKAEKDVYLPSLKMRRRIEEAMGLEAL